MPESRVQFVEEFYQIMDKVFLSFEQVDLREIDGKKKRLDEARPLPQEALKSLEGKLRIDEVHNSTAIEGNGLTLGETALVLERGITVEGKPLKDHLEVVGYDEALKFIKDIVTQKDKYPLSEDLVKDIHKIMFKKMEDVEADHKHGIGFYRDTQCFISGSRYIPPSPEKVSDLMKNFIEYLNKKEAGMHSVQQACLWHFGFTYIHPFADGNGRVARLLMNLILMRNGYPITVVPLSERSKYMAALEKASVEHNGKNFLEFIIEAIDNSFKLYFSII